MNRTIFGIIVLALAIIGSQKWISTSLYAFRLPEICIPSSSKTDEINLKRFVGTSSLNDLRNQLASNFPYDADAAIPRKIWQTWKVSLSNTTFPTYYKPLVQKWMESKSDSYTLVTDDEILPLILKLYHNVPLVIEAIKNMPLTILKIDFLRYLLLYAQGGIYTDLDTMPLKPLNYWHSTNTTLLQKLVDSTSPILYKNANSTLMNFSDPTNEPGFVIGIEADPDRVDWQEWYARRIQFCQWTIQSKPGHPILRELILNITATTLYSTSTTHEKYMKYIDLSQINDYHINFREQRQLENGLDHAHLKTNATVDGTDIMNWTGPGIFTDVIFHYFNNLINHNKDIVIRNPNLQRHGRLIKYFNKIQRYFKLYNVFPWEFFSLMTEPVIIDDVMVLPITSFSPDVNQMGAKSLDDEMAFVEHLFQGTWKKIADINKTNLAKLTKNETV